MHIIVMGSEGMILVKSTSYIEALVCLLGLYVDMVGLYYKYYI